MSTQIKGSKRIFTVAVVLLLLMYGSSVYHKNAKDLNAYKQHESLVAEASECLELADWKCAERNVQKLLDESPNDTNLQMHMAGILFEQERYEECQKYIDGLKFKNRDMEFLKEKSNRLLREMTELGIEKSMHFRLEFEGNPSKKDVMEALAVLEVAYDSISRLFDFSLENKISLVLYQSTDYQGVGPRPDWVGAVFDGKLRVPVGVMEYSEVYRPMLFHELTHAFVSAMTRASVPLWMNEGIAQVIDASRKDEPRPEGAAPDLQALTEPFVNQENREFAVKLYWYSQKMVEILLYTDGATYGSSAAAARMKKLRACIQELRDLGTDGALRKYFGMTSAQLLERVN